MSANHCPIKNYLTFKDLLDGAYVRESEKARKSDFITRTLTDSKEIQARLAGKESNTEILGMVSSLTVRNSTDGTTLKQVQIENALAKKRSFDTEAAERMLVYLCLSITLEVNAALNAHSHRRWDWLGAINPTDKLIIGVFFYKGTTGVIDYEKAACHLRAAVRGGAGEGYYYLVLMYRNGEGVEECNVTAVEVFQKGVRANDAAAMTALGQCYLYGVGVARSRENGVKYVEMGADRDDPIGLSVCGCHKMYGYNTRKNLTTSFQLIKKPIEKENMKAK